MKHDPIIIDRRSLADRVTEPMAPEPLDIFTIVIGACIVALAFFAWIS